MKIELDLPEIEGYEYTGEYRKPKSGEYFPEGQQAMQVEEDAWHYEEYPILKRKASKYEVINVSEGYAIHRIGTALPSHRKFVEIKALEDAISIIDTHYNWSADSREAALKLKELIK